MESLTKYKQSMDVIRKMVHRIFPENDMVTCCELTEGYFNVAYKIGLADGREVILKIAPRKDMRIMTYEKNIMYSEVSAMRLAKEKGNIPVPQILGYDDSLTICESPYFFMEKIEGDSLNAIRSQFTEEQIHAIYRTVGQLDASINEIVCPYFGYPGQKELQGSDWYTVFCKMIDACVADAQNGNVDLKISIEKLKEMLNRDQEIFKEVTEPKLIHWDCWDGNIFIKDGKVSGIIDWERCIFGDPLLEVGFRSYDKNTSFCEGYGLVNMTESQKRRVLWYDVYLLMLMSMECEYRKYETMDMYHWATELLSKQFNLL